MAEIIPRVRNRLTATTQIYRGTKRVRIPRGPSVIHTSPRHPYGRDLEAREEQVPCRDGRHRVTAQRRIGPAHVRVRFTDLLEDVLKLTTPNIWQSGLDLKDYFYMWAYTQADADYWGLCDPVTGEYDRLGFCGFGGAQSPCVAQRWSRHIHRLIIEHGLKYCTTERTRNPEEGLSCTGVLLDDFHHQHLASLTQ